MSKCKQGSTDDAEEYGVDPSIDTMFVKQKDVPLPPPPLANGEFSLNSVKRKYTE